MLDVAPPSEGGVTNFSVTSVGGTLLDLLRTPHQRVTVHALTKTCFVVVVVVAVAIAHVVVSC